MDEDETFNLDLQEEKNSIKTKVHYLILWGETHQFFTKMSSYFVWKSMLIFFLTFKKRIKLCNFLKPEKVTKISILKLNPPKYILSTNSDAYSLSSLGISINEGKF